METAEAVSISTPGQSVERNTDRSVEQTGERLVGLPPALSAGLSRVEAALERICSRWLPEVPNEVAEAIRYAVVSEGKRLRPILMLEAYSACGGSGDAADLAASIEVVHAYSLVHDDLPCMDDDDLRRGRPTVHRAFGIPVATTAGLAMVPLAARAAWQSAQELGLSIGEASEILHELMQASGGGGMVGGQLLDLEAERSCLALSDLERVHRLKTGALIRASVTLGARAARATDKQRFAFDHYGASIGLAFQIADDILDVTATSAQLGKTAGRDVALGKSTFPGLMGVDGARRKAEALVEEACAALEAEQLLTPALEQIARFIVERRS